MIIYVILVFGTIKTIDYRANSHVMLRVVKKEKWTAMSFLKISSYKLLLVGFPYELKFKKNNA